MMGKCKLSDQECGGTHCDHKNDHDTSFGCCSNTGFCSLKNKEVICIPNDIKYLCTCINCGATDNLVMRQHINSEGRMVGWLFVCMTCHPKLKSGAVETHLIPSGDGK